MKILLAKFLLFVLFLAVLRPVSAQCPLFRDPGQRAAVDNGRAIVSTYATGPGVQFYDKTSQGWQRRQSFGIGDLQLFFDSPVAIDGDRAIAGSCESHAQVGKAFVFDRVGDQWVQTELISGTVEGADFFGSSVAIDENVAVVGALHFGKGGGDELARMHIFEFDGTSWSEVAQILPYTTAVDVDGDTIVLGEGLTSPGSVQVYRKVAGLWTWTHRLFPVIPNGPFLGSSVALEGNTLVVGASYGSGPVAGYVQVFRRQGSNWLHAQHIVPSNSAIGDRFGASVALSGTTLLVGAPAAGTIGTGTVHRFELVGSSFREVDQFGSDPVEFGFGENVALDRGDAILSYLPHVTFYRIGFAHEESFCPTTPNSTGSPGNLSVEGCDSLDGQSFTLVASGLPAGVLGGFLFGANATQVPFGDGFRCVGDPFFQLPSGTTDATGGLIHQVDFATSPGSAITAGQTWNFQAFHRDPSTAANLNLTNALSIGITP